MNSPRITSTSVEVCKDTITPCIMLNIRIEGIEAGTSIYIPVDGVLYSDDGKYLTSLIIDYVRFSSAGALATPAIVINYSEYYSSEKKHALDIRARALLEPNAINYIEKRRRINKYRRVELNLKLRFLRLNSSVYHYNNVYRARDFPILRFPENAVILKSREPLLFIDNTIYSELETPIVIDGPRWIKDLLPKLGLGNYMILELPLPKQPSIPEEALRHLVNAVRSLERARETIYETLDIGPPLTALRNSLIEFCYALKSLGLATGTKSGGCTLAKEKLIELFHGNEKLAKLVMEVFTNAKRIATRGPDPTQPHLATEPAPTLYQVESLIGLVAYMFKIVLDSIAYASNSS